MNMKIFFATILAALSVTFALKTMQRESKSEQEEIDQYIRKTPALFYKGTSGTRRLLPDGKKEDIVEIFYKDKWVPARLRLNSNGTPDESFGPQGLRAQ